MSQHLTPSDEALIIAYLSGQATQAQSLEFEKRIVSDPEFSAQVDRLESWLAPLDENISDHAPPDGLLDQIMMQIETQNDSTAAGSAPSASAVPTAAPAPANDRSALTFWRTAAIAASLIAFASIGLHLVPASERSETTEPRDYVERPPVTLPAEPPLLALLSGETPSPLVAIIYNQDTGQVVARLSNVEVPDDGDLQLWLIREGEETPQSLGLLERTEDGQVEIESPAVLNPETDVLAVSLEALGGSRSAGPEGPVLFTGAVTPT